ncbi:hypothetical protein IW261DRAFT_1427999 [Armillaria novae-zelandiae]|uniref:Uncharacterized protein n=1 Tax=Armillaria novae-zelandiae TaxID=153914 RepID=A0AA39TQB5_9AGAR|nr:hypothetical protein IW261DRAFT_1427999 [Armillaria novae-zelandiae]
MDIPRFAPNDTSRSCLRYSPSGTCATTDTDAFPEGWMHAFWMSRGNAAGVSRTHEIIVVHALLAITPAEPVSLKALALCTNAEDGPSSGVIITAGLSFLTPTSLSFLQDCHTALTPGLTRASRAGIARERVPAQEPSRGPQSTILLWYSHYVLCIPLVSLPIKTTFYLIHFPLLVGQCIDVDAARAGDSETGGKNRPFIDEYGPSHAR